MIAPGAEAPGHSFLEKHMNEEPIKVQPWSEDQGDYVLIDAASFDEAVHKLYVEKKPSKDKNS